MECRMSDDAVRRLVDAEELRAGLGTFARVVDGKR